MLHILPESKVPVPQLPIDVFINRQVSFYRKRESQGVMMQRDHTGQNMTQREEQEALAQTQGFILIPEFQFEHVIYPLNKENMATDPTG